MMCADKQKSQALSLAFLGTEYGIRTRDFRRERATS